MCPLCHSKNIARLATAHSRTYDRCQRCHLVFLTAEHHLPPEEERRHYLTHNNDPSDSDYRAFLSRLADPLVECLEAGMHGLDYGSGPGPTLSVMLEEQGFNMNIYDPFFAPDEEAVQQRYDFISCSETVEHFFDPAAEFDRFDQMLQPGGWLGIMTQMRTDEQDFTEWWYIRDPTHVCFYHEATLRWIAGAYGWCVSNPVQNVTLFHKMECT